MSMAPTPQDYLDSQLMLVPKQPLFLPRVSGKLIHLKKDKVVVTKDKTN